MTPPRSFPSYSKASCKMCSRREHPLRGKVPNHKNSQCQCFSQGPALRQNGETCHNPDANAGPLVPVCTETFNVNAVRCRPSTFDTIWISGGWTSRRNFRFLPPLNLPGKTSGSIFFSPSSVRTPLWKDATLEKILRMLNVNGKLRNCTFWIIKRMAPVLLVLTWPFFFWLVAAWVKSRAERPSVSGVNRQLHVQIGCKLGIRNRKDELTKQAKRNELQINPKVIKGVNACRKRTRSS